MEPLLKGGVVWEAVAGSVEDEVDSAVVEK